MPAKRVVQASTAATPLLRNQSMLGVPATEMRRKRPGRGRPLDGPARSPAAKSAKRAVLSAE